MVKLRDILNESCVEAGVCPEPRLSRAAELWRDGSKNKILVALWEDGTITNCLIQKGDEKCCFSAESGGEALYDNWCGLLTSPEVAYRIKVIEIERE